MQTLNLAHLEESDIKYTLTTFPDGEPHIVIDSSIGKYPLKVITRICNPTDLMILMEINDILTRYEIEWYLNITYLMSARMDRVMSINRPYSLKIVANILKELSCYKIEVLDVHNFEKFHLLCDPIHTINEVHHLDFSDKNKTVVYPDKGSYYRYHNTLRKTAIVFKKVRNIDTGEILSFEIENNPNVTCEDFVFVDDLCDGGGTFLGELSILKEKYPNGNFSIYITHCVNEIGLRKLLNSFDKVYTTNSYKDWDLIFPEQIKSGRLVVDKVI